MSERMVMSGMLLLLVEKNEGFEVERLKGYELKNVNSLDKYDPGRFIKED